MVKTYTIDQPGLTNLNDNTTLFYITHDLDFLSDRIEIQSIGGLV